MVTITKYVWDAVFDCVTHELDENNNVKAEYHNEPQQYGGVLSQRRGTTSHYHHHDALGSTRFLTDSSGNVTDTYLNDAWGNLVASTGTTVNPFKWVGKYGYYTDDTTAQVYVRARMYQRTVARWVSADPIQFVDGMNTYSYVLNRGLVFTDSSGYEVDLALAPESPVGMKFSFADFINDRILGNTCRWFDIDVACRRCVENCEPGFAPRYAYIYLQQAIIFDLENIDARGLDYKKTYGHEQLHVSNGIEKAKALKKELEARLAKSKCITGDLELAEIKCNLEASEIALEFVTKWKEWEKLDSDHKLEKPKRGTGYPPIDGKVGKTVSPNADVKECVQKVNDANPIENKAMNCAGACS